MKAYIFILFIFVVNVSRAQETPKIQYPIGADFLLINPDTKSSGMGNLKTVGSLDANSVFSNSARIPFDKDDLISEVGITYNPMARNIDKDVNLLTLSGNFYTGGSEYSSSYVSGFLQYYNIGNVHFTDEQGNEMDFYRPKEYALGASFAKRYGEYFALGLTAKGIYSKLGVGRFDPNMQDAMAFAIDISLYGEFPTVNGGIFSTGLVANNIGSKLKYSTQHEASLPSAARLGAGYKKMFDGNQESFIFIGGEIGKPLVSYEEGKNFMSNKAMTINLGAEIMFNGLFALRTGYAKDNFIFNQINVFTVGTTVATYMNNNRLAFDVGYQMPTGNKSYGMGNIFKFGISYSFFE